MSELCKGEAFDEGPGGGWRRCTFKAKRDGFCGVHHPDAVKAREERERRKMRERQARNARTIKRERDRAELLDAARRLAERLETGELVAYAPDGSSPQDRERAEAVLAEFLKAADELRP